MTKKLTENWRALTPEEKKVYEDKAAQDRERYQDEMEAKGLAKKKIDAGAPKKPRTAFILYSVVCRESLKKDEPELKQTEILKRIGELWNGLDEEKRKVHLEQAKEDKKRYDKEIAEYDGAKA